MPNWCEGELKIRGKKIDIIRFMEEGIQPMTPLAESLEKIKFTQGEFSTYVYMQEKIFNYRGRESFH